MIFIVVCWSDEAFQTGTEKCSQGTGIPAWSTYNTLISNLKEVTKVGTPPLLDAPADEWPIMQTILMKAHNITTNVIGPGRKTVISLNMGPYQPPKKLQMTRDDLQNLSQRRAKLHIGMTQLHTIGVFNLSKTAFLTRARLRLISMVRDSKTDTWQ